LLRIAAAEFRAMLNRENQMSLYLHELQALESWGQIETLVEICCYSARARLERFLMQIASESCSFGPFKGTALPIPLKHQEIAQLLAITPEHLSRILRELESEGALRRSKNLLFLCHPLNLTETVGIGGP
jgi:CRP-like cAMP-binding protein